MRVAVMAKPTSDNWDMDLDFSSDFSDDFATFDEPKVKEETKVLNNFTNRQIVNIHNGVFDIIEVLDAPCPSF